MPRKAAAVTAKASRPSSAIKLCLKRPVHLQLFGIVARQVLPWVSGWLANAVDSKRPGKALEQTWPKIIAVVHATVEARIPPRNIALT